MSRIKLTVISSRCRGGYCAEGDVFFVDDLCPPICHELWACAYPMIYALQNGARLDYGGGKAQCFEVKCPDEGRVTLRGEVVDS